jgi:hypothetical protein
LHQTPAFALRQWAALLNNNEIASTALIVGIMGMHFG